MRAALRLLWRCRTFPRPVGSNQPDRVGLGAVRHLTWPGRRMERMLPSDGLPLLIQPAPQGAVRSRATQVQRSVEVQQGEWETKCDSSTTRIRTKNSRRTRVRFPSHCWWNQVRQVVVKAGASHDRRTAPANKALHLTAALYSRFYGVPPRSAGQSARIGLIGLGFRHPTWPGRRMVEMLSSDGLPLLIHPAPR